jgi:protein gp37
MTPNLDWLLLTKRPENILTMVPPRWLSAPPRNVWYGATAENQEYFDRRWRHLNDVPAEVRFISAEPLLGPIGLHNVGLGRLHWIIVGGESGHHARPFEIEWARSLLRQCGGVGARPFVKQFGAQPWHGTERLRLNSAKGSDMSEWPTDLQVQDFPRHW